LVATAGRRSKENLKLEETIDIFNMSGIVNMNEFFFCCCLFFLQVISSRSSQTVAKQGTIKQSRFEII